MNLVFLVPADAIVAGVPSTRERLLGLLRQRGHGIEVVQAPRSAWAGSILPLLLRLRSLRPRPEVLVSFGTIPCGWIAGLADVFLGIPSVVWIGDENGSDSERPHVDRRSIFAWRQARRCLIVNARQRERLLAHVARFDPLRSERMAQRLDVLPGNGLPPAESKAEAWDAIADRLEGVLREVAPRAPRVWMVSPNPTSRGGVAAVARQIATSSLTRKYRISMLPTYAPGSMLARLYRGAVGILQVGMVMLIRKPDLVHIKIASGGSFARKVVVGAICRMQGVPVLVHVHGGGFDHFISRSPGVVRAAAHWLLEGTPQVLTLSERWAAKLQPMFPRARIDVLPNPVEVARYCDLAQARFARPLQARTAAPMAVFLGDLLARKGAFDLVAAWPEVVRGFPGARLVLCGTGDADGLRASARELGVERAVELPGWVDLETKRRLLGEATVFALPSHIEGVPISLLEAMASGLPSVVTPVGGILDAVTDEQEALIVPVRDPAAVAHALLRVFESPALARRLGEGARARVDEFDVRAFAAQLDRIYQRILGHEDPAPGALVLRSKEVA